jgi:hypothetical protein
VSVELVQAVSCPMYLFSTDGSRFGHPDPEAVARIIRHGEASPTLAFNYRSEQNRIWDDATLMEQYHYQVRYPVDGQAGLEINLGSSPPARSQPLDAHGTMS